MPDERGAESQGLGFIAKLLWSPAKRERRREPMIAANERFSVKGRTALVTGGATGLGRICAEGLLGAGARCLIASRKPEACEAVAEELPHSGPARVLGVRS